MKRVKIPKPPRIPRTPKKPRPKRFKLDDDMIKVTLEFSTPEDAIIALAAIRTAQGADKAAATVTTPAKDKPNPKSATTGNPAAGKPAVEGGKTTEAEAAPEKKGPESSGSATGDAYEPIGAMIKAKVPTHRAEVLALLTEFGAKSGKDLKPTQYEAFLEKLTAVGEDLG